MNKAYTRINWENYPSNGTPLNEENLNKMDASIDELDNRSIAMDATKLDKTTAATMVKEVEFDEATGIFTITKLNGSTFTIDTKLEKIIVNFTFDKDTQKLVIILDDGTKQYVDLSALITQYEFLDSETIAFTLNADGTITADIKNGSITEDKLRPNYLADIKVESANAKSSAAAAATSETNAKASETAAKESEDAASTSEQNAKISETAAANSATKATSKANEASESATAASASATTASEKASAASTSEKNAKSSADSANSYKNTAAQKANEASESASEASNSATEAESYAHGGTNTRDNEDADNAKYYYEQAKQISQGINGVIPMGTVAFADIPTSGLKYGYMYNVSDGFISDARFNDGGGVYYGSGNNIIWVAGDKWDVLAGSSVTGVKGNAESTYRQGNVNITPTNIGLGNVPNVSTNNQTPTYTVASANANLTSGEKLSVAFGKIAKAISSLITHLADTVKHITEDERTAWNNLKTSKLGDFAAVTDVTISSVTYHTYWEVAPTSSNQVYGVAVHPTNGILYRIYNNKGTYSLYSYDTNSTYTGGTLKTAAVKTGSGTTVTNSIAASTTMDNAIGTLLNNDAAMSASVKENKEDIATINSKINELNSSMNNKASINHNHDDRYYTESEIDNTLVTHYCYGGATRWLPNGEDLSTKSPGYWQCSPNNKPSIGLPSWCSEYGALFSVKGDYTFIIYIDVFGKFGMWSSNQHKWNSMAAVSNELNGGTIRNNDGVSVINNRNTAYSQVTASAFNQKSSKLVKENISEITDDEAKNILNLTPIHFDYIKEYGGIKNNIGFIAEEVLNYIPQAVTVPEHYSETEFDKKQGINNDVLSLDYSKLIVHAIKMIQIQQKQIEELKNKINS